MREYLRIVNNVLDYGVWKENRTGIRCLTRFGEIFRHDMKDGFPLLTTKKMYLKGILVELEGFIKGITSKKWYQERGCHIWDDWSSPMAIKEYIYNSEPGTRVDIPQKCDDLGPIYGYQWRRFNQCYDENDDGTLETYDQLKFIVETLKANPNDRRLVCSAWNPQQNYMMALPPCHLMWHVVHNNGYLNLCWYQRSCDLMLGIPFNIASYGTLLLLLCKEANLKPGELMGFLADCHIYENQMNGVEEQLTRSPRPLPNLEITGQNFNIFEWTYENVKLTAYNPYPKIDFGPVAV